MADGAIPLAGAPLLIVRNSGQPISTQQRQGVTPPDANAQLRRAAEEFESVFLAEMMAPMFEGIDTNGLGGGGMGEEMFRPMLVQRYAESIARSGGVGIADSVVREMMRLQEAVIPPESTDGADR